MNDCEFKGLLTVRSGKSMLGNTSRTSEIQIKLWKNSVYFRERLTETFLTLENLMKD